MVWPEQPSEVLPEELARCYGDRLRSFAFRRLRNSAAAEDVAQEALLRVLEALRAGKVRSMEALPAYLFQTALNICLHHGRSKQRGGRALESLARTAQDPGDGKEPVQELIARERRLQVRRALQRLSAQDRNLLLMAYAEALSSDEISRRLKVLPGVVRVRKYRALRRLAQILGEKTRVTEMRDREL